MKIIGLTGSISSGKNFVAEIFVKNGAMVFDADAEVHDLFKSNKVIFSKILEFFPQAIIDKKIERKILGKIVFENTQKLQILEKIIHPQVRKKYSEFLKEAESKNSKFVILNIPLLLEKQGYDCDKIISVIIKKSLQKRRFLSRARKLDPKNFKKEEKNLEKKFEQIFSKQLTNLERKKRSDFIIRNDISKSHTVKQVKKILKFICK